MKPGYLHPFKKVPTQLAGIASQVIHGMVVSESGGGWHYAQFVVDSKAVEVVSSSRIAISDGDMVSVAGIQERKVFKALAYKNCTKRIQGDAGMIGTLCIAYACVFLGLVALSASAYVALFFSLIGIIALVRSGQIKASLQLLNTR